MNPFEQTYFSKTCPFCKKPCATKNDSGKIAVCENCPYKLKIYYNALFDDGIEITLSSDLCVFYDREAYHIDINKYVSDIKDITIPSEQFCHDISKIKNDVKTILNFS